MTLRTCPRSGTFWSRWAWGSSQTMALKVSQMEQLCSSSQQACICRSHRLLPRSCLHLKLPFCSCCSGLSSESRSWRWIPSERLWCSLCPGRSSHTGRLPPYALSTGGKALLCRQDVFQLSVIRWALTSRLGLLGRPSRLARAFRGGSLGSRCDRWHRLSGLWLQRSRLRMAVLYHSRRCCSIFELTRWSRQCEPYSIWRCRTCGFGDQTR